MGTKLVVVAVGFAAAMPQIAAADVAEDYCFGFLPVVEQALVQRQQGTPIEDTTSMADHAMDIDFNLYAFLVAAIEFAYDDPHSTAKMIADGRMLAACVQQVSSY